MRTYRLKNRGQAIVLVAIALVVLITLAGLALDGGIAYAVKAKLSSAVDAAAIAAGRSLTCSAPATTCDDTTRKASAVAAATKFFNANFPSGYLRATPTLLFSPSDIVHNANGSWDITVNATATVPTYFLRIIGDNTFTAKALAATHKRDLDMAFVVDNSGSMSSVCAGVREDAKTFIRKFDSSSDRLALINFAYAAHVAVSITNPGRGFTMGDCTPNSSNSCNLTGTSNTVCGEITNFRFGGNTNSSEGFWRARDQLNSISSVNRSSFRAIVFFTDGSPNSFSSTFTFNNGSTHTGAIITDDGSSGSVTGLYEVNQVRTSSESSFPAANITTPFVPSPLYFNVGNTADTEFTVCPQGARYGGTRGAVTCAKTFANVNRASRNLLEDMALKARQEGIFVFTLGLGNLLTSSAGPDNERGERILARMANDPRPLTDGWVDDTYNPSQPLGMYCFAADSSQLAACFQAVANQILRLTK